MKILVLLIFLFYSLNAVAQTPIIGNADHHFQYTGISFTPTLSYSTVPSANNIPQCWVRGKVTNISQFIGAQSFRITFFDEKGNLLDGQDFAFSNFNRGDTKTFSIYTNAPNCNFNSYKIDSDS